MQIVSYDGTPLQRLTLEEEIAQMAADTSSGTPLRWAWWGEDLYLSPAPGETGKNITILGVLLPPALAF